MRAERIQYSSQGRRVPFFRAPELASASLRWTGFSFEEASGPNEPLPAHAWAKTTLLYVTDGQASLRWKHRGVWNGDLIERGTVSIIRRDAEIQNAVPDGAIEMMVLQLDGARLETLAPDEVLAIERSLESAQVTQDPQLAALMAAMRAEVRGGCRSGRLYAESISTALLAYLAARYAAPHAEAGAASGLSPAEMRRLVGHIRENLSGAISVTELAALARMSPSHFARVFKAASGMTPYQCVMRERVARAKTLLAERIPSGRVAAEVGFASQSHFAKVFLQVTGVTPKRYRADC
ncbi:helix-turn-helix domain-containing protein [Hansschlegelia zhihuaiae]|uniref:AraC family transcriptional regulator n=1 Tax=Hansschlegelia zhihuaiae TaxID=405005 RepID=A0A4V1KJT3_9HYPH|nr:AraC family transcriptional regulator [Hansschlegelia zhihuaiae]RXF75292.1 AraC family transcriptional regulator [Hansschlegelia zhihuaiae]